MDLPRTASDSCVVRRVQKSLEQIYRIRLDSDIQNFLVDRNTLGLLARQLGFSHAPCQVILLEGRQDPEIAVHVDEAILKRLESLRPIEYLSSGSIGDFCALTEEVSHFVYLVWNIRNERSIRRLEIELQAEVDKYVLCALILLQQDCLRGIRDLGEQLFYRFRLDERLEPREKKRYLEANLLARQYCSFLERRYLRYPSPPSLLEEIRFFYRLPQEDKIHRIRSLPFQ